MRKRIVALAAVLALSGGCTGGGGTSTSPPASPTAELWHGGTLRIQAWMWDVEILDPATSYFVGPHWELYRCCLLRTLMSYNGRSVDQGGAEALPDLASEPPEVSVDGLTWTFRMREGLRYGPPFEDTEIVAQDVVRALARIPAPSPEVYEYGFIYSMIEGFDAFRAGDADSISGLETPDDHTLVVRLTEPAGDLPYRFSMHATAPVPPGADDGHLGEYFRYLVSSGPYMIEGSEELDFSLRPKQQEPVSGFTPQAEIDERGEPRVGLTLVRNPSWDPATDPLRAAYADRIEFVLVPTQVERDPATVRDFAGRLDRGDVDLLYVFSQDQLERYRSDPALEDRVVFAPQLEMGYLPMNLAVPPFDDVHVRRAVSLVLNRVELTDRFSEYSGAAWTYEPANHLLPDALAGGLISSEWRPTWAEELPPEGDLAAAEQEMTLSRYDHDGDGRCDDDVCSHVRTIVERGWGPGDNITWFADLIRDDLARIGVDLELTVQSGPAACATAARPEERFALGVGICIGGFGADYLNGSTFALPLWHSTSIKEETSNNRTLLGATDDQLRDWGYDVTSVPSVDDRIDRCMVIVGADQVMCWVELDRYLMEEVVPMAPLMTRSRLFLLSGRVADWSYSEYGVHPAIDRIALVPGSE